MVQFSGGHRLLAMRRNSIVTRVGFPGNFRYLRRLGRSFPRRCAQKNIHAATDRTFRSLQKIDTEFVRRSRSGDGYFFLHARAGRSFSCGQTGDIS
ncbi:hypothetical protein AB7M49_000741 [Bradyrhizobium elkanii]